VVLDSSELAPLVVSPDVLVADEAEPPDSLDDDESPFPTSC
jgi:hypothetical protein